ncbi:hypothetical protein FGO68_gene14427 [Halteria grandinella]|uniref:Uncharacterized protein n=1 Tax=Halteria grandinella TaxID=5974 RepID=A0A8J8P2Q2_HALGN|nr:hypothetical protein FGO68_gene14427 [Halteria grandinella]
MSEIIQHKFKDMGKSHYLKLNLCLVAGFFFSVMADQTKAIVSDFQDALHSLQRDFIVGKNMFEFTNANLNEEFALATKEFKLEEAFKMSFFSQNWNWYVFPFANGSSPYYTLNTEQERDVQYCQNNHYFYKTFRDFPQLLISSESFFVGFDSGVLCTKGNTIYFKMPSRNYSLSYCNCDSQGNCYYSSVCRPWFVSQKEHPLQCFFSDLFQQVGGTGFAFGITSPLNEVNGQFAGAYYSNIVPSYSPQNIYQAEGNYIKRMYFPEAQQSNYLISDNQPIWDSNWNVTSYSAYLQQVADFTMKTLIQNFKVQYEFPHRDTKIAYFDWKMTKQQVLEVNLLLQCYHNVELLCIY